MQCRKCLVAGLISAAAFAALISWKRPAVVHGQTASPVVPAGTSKTIVRSADWLNALPEGETRRQVVLGCTPCHQLGPPIAFKKTLDEWKAVVTRMKQIDDDLDLALIRLDADDLAKWLHDNSTMPAQSHVVAEAEAEFREYPVGDVKGFYHDMAVTAGRAWIADYFGNTLYAADIDTGRVQSWPIPVNVPAGQPGGAHQIDTTRDGSLWITFTKANQVMRFDPVRETFQVFSNFEPGSNVQYFVVDKDRDIYEDGQGGIWVTHFSREILSRLDPATGAITVFDTPRTEGVAEKGVHLYAAVADSGGRLWYTETHGNRFGVLDPKTRAAEEWDMPEAFVGPKRLAIDDEDRIWIPELTTGKITVYDTRQRRVVERLTLPIPGDFPYGIRRNRYTGDLWVTGSGSDALYRLDPRTRTFEVYRLPRQGAYTRTVVFTADGAIWTCYASFPNVFTPTPYGTGVVVRLMPGRPRGRTP
jgi:streptogramin lyase